VGSYGALQSWLAGGASRAYLVVGEGVGLRHGGGGVWGLRCRVEASVVVQAAVVQADGTRELGGEVQGPAARSADWR
jgi:hypothetical protein